MIGAIVLNGEKYNGEIIGDYIIATDGGYDKCKSCDLVVGDMDSVADKIDNVPSIVLNPDKDLTDGEYAVNLMIEKGVKIVNIYGLNGGRLDHILANIGLMSRLVKAGVKAVCHCNDFTGYMINADLILDNIADKTISLVPFTDEVHIIYLKGVKWPIEDVTIYKSSSLTISNLAVTDKVLLAVDDGEVFVIVNK